MRRASNGIGSPSTRACQDITIRPVAAFSTAGICDTASLVRELGPHGNSFGRQVSYIVKGSLVHQADEFLNNYNTVSYFALMPHACALWRAYDSAFYAM